MQNRMPGLDWEPGSFSRCESGSRRGEWPGRLEHPGGDDHAAVAIIGLLFLASTLAGLFGLALMVGNA